MIYSIVIAPIEAVVDWIFSFIINKIPSLGVIGAICGVSVCVNILALPLYNIAEAIQEKERQINKKMEPRVKRIKKGFKGDEQFMILSEYYRQNNYHPLYALRGSLSILIEIPFFIAAYNYLSSSEILKESSFWVFSNLGEADQMFSITLGSLVIPINILPILMTAINFVSGYIYTKNATTRDKIQLYALGLVFLVLLYNSPSGLVIYWILNNIFSLVKTIVLKTKHPGRFLHAFLSLLLIALTYRFRNATTHIRFILAAVFTTAFILFPFTALPVIRKAAEKKGKKEEGNSSTGSYLSVVLMSGLALALLCGFLLPSSTIATSPEEFSFIGDVENPTTYVWSTLWFFTGFFVFWPLVIFKMFGPKVKKWEAMILFVLLVMALTNAFVFTSDYGSIDVNFMLETDNDLYEVSLFNRIGEVAVPVLAAILFIVLDHLGRTGILTLIALTAALSEAVVGTVKLSAISSRYKAYAVTVEKERETETETDSTETVYHLSRIGKNVVVIFLDRAFNQFFPYVIEQYPELKKQMEGFVYYPNTVSLGGNTTFAFPAMAGGYEYTEEKMNERPETQREIHNEASIVAPTLFDNAGYSVTITDPMISNYTWRDDYTAYENLPDVTVRYTSGDYTDRFIRENSDGGVYNASESTRKEARNFSILQILPPSLRLLYNVSCRGVRDLKYYTFLDYYAAFHYLDELTDFTDDGNTYIFMGSDVTHTPVYLNDGLTSDGSRFNYSEVEYPTTDELTIKHYLPYARVFIKLGEWFDYLRENGCWDNTRIIIVSDHGFNLDSSVLNSTQTQFNPLLLYKDFGSSGEIVTDNTFMTNADSIFLSIEGLEEISNVNPYTGNELKQEKEDGVDVYQVVVQEEWNAPSIPDLVQFTLDRNQAYHVKDNIFDSSNWIRLSEWEETEE